MPREIDPYIRTLFFADVADLGITSAFFRRNEIIPVIENHIRQILNKHSVDGITDVEELSESIFSELLAERSFIEDEPRFAGKYYRYNQKRYVEYRAKWLEADGIAHTARKIGARFYPDVFAGYLASISEVSSDEIGVPASDRIVNLRDNSPEIDKIRKDIADLQNQLRSNNDVGGLTPEEAEAAADEVGVIAAVLEGSSVRVSTIASIATRTLRWVAEKAASAAVGKAAWALLVFIATFFGFIN